MSFDGSSLGFGCVSPYVQWSSKILADKARSVLPFQNLEQAAGWSSVATKASKTISNF
jgi:hypothetical protein